MIKFEHSSYNSNSFPGYVPASGHWYFSDELSDMETLEYAAYSGALAHGFSLISRMGEQVTANILVPETVESMLPPHNSGESSDVFFRGRVESPERPVVLPDRFSQPVKFLDGNSGILYSGEGIKIASVGGRTDFGVAPEMGNAFRHREPAYCFPPFAYTSSPHFEFAGTVYDSLHAQYVPGFVVHLDPVSLHPVFDTGARPPSPGGVYDVACESSVELSAEEGHDILTAEEKCCMLQQFFIQGLQATVVLEDDIRGKFGLFRNPAIFHGRQEVLKQGVDASGKSVEYGGPLKFGEFVGDVLSPLEVIDMQEGIAAHHGFFAVKQALCKRCCACRAL